MASKRALGLLLRAPLDWLGIAAWGTRSGAHDARPLVQGVVDSEAGVLGLNNDHNAYVIDIVRDRLNLTERARKTIALHRKWRPLQVRYEQYGMQADIEHIRYLQREQNYRFAVEEVGGQVPKNDRIRRLLPWFEQGRIYFPKTLYYTDYEGQRKGLDPDISGRRVLCLPGLGPRRSSRFPCQTLGTRPESPLASRRTAREKGRPGSEEMARTPSS